VLLLGLPAAAQVFTVPAPVYTDPASAIPFLVRVGADNSGVTSMAWSWYAPAGESIYDVLFSQSAAGGPFSAPVVVAGYSLLSDMRVTPSGTAHLISVPTGIGGLQYCKPSAGGCSGAQARITAESPANWAQVAADDAGHVYVVWAGPVNGVPCLAASRSTDGGSSFTPPVCFANSSGYPRIAVDALGRLQVAYLDDIVQVTSPSYSITATLYCQRWDPASLTGFTARAPVANFPTGGFSLDIATDASGAVGIAWTEGGYTPVSLHYARSVDGVTFTSRTLAAGGQTPRLTFDARGGAHVAWEQFDSSWNVFYAYAADGVSFAPNVQLSQTTSVDQEAWAPRIFVDARGFQNVAWNLWDYPTNTNAVYFSRAADRSTFTTQKISAADSHDAELAVDGSGRATVAWSEWLQMSGSSVVDADVWYTQAASSLPANVPPGVPVPPGAGPPANPGPPPGKGPNK